MIKKIRKRKVTQKYKQTTCHYCAEFYDSKIRQTSGEFVTRNSKGKKIRVTGNIIYRFCPAVRAFTTSDEKICSEENFSITPWFYCLKRSCWLSTNQTCYASRTRKLDVCMKCRQFDLVISKITEKPEIDYSKRPSALQNDLSDLTSTRISQNIPVRTDESHKTRKSFLKRKRKTKSDSIPIVTNIKRTKLKRRRK